MPNDCCANASFPMPLANLAALLAVADRLDLLELDYAFVGGANKWSSLTVATVTFSGATAKSRVIQGHAGDGPVIHHQMEAMALLPLAVCSCLTA